MKLYQKYILLAIVYIFMIMIPVISSVGEHRSAYIINADIIAGGFVIIIISIIIGIFIGYQFYDDEN